MDFFIIRRLKVKEWKGREEEEKDVLGREQEEESGVPFAVTPISPFLP